ncbi:hypothetical protein FGG08_007546 [Glutinoglossum americanum]|uniref:Uncharacterized protein n=1 Tax=Glutinoglossum americanum TaxID=1670608 RepID=A0A9P8I333_9PEZI|nr:hypothetical protein FGG08_007546 [Glutinoglossum americanum]
MAVPNGPLPDFAAIRSHLTEAGDQIALCANIPGVQGGNQIAALLGAMNENIQHVRDEVGALRGEVGTLRGEVGALRGEVGTLRGEVGALRGEVEALRGEVGALRGEVGNLRVQVENMHRGVQAEKRNSIARLINTRVTNAGVPIEPLVGEDGDPIPEFPGTAQALRDLDDQKLDQILQHLSLRTTGTSAAKKDRVQMHAGVINIPQGRLR